MQSNNILFIIRSYDITDGSSITLNAYIRNNPSIKNYKIIARYVLSAQEDLNITEVSSWKEIRKILEKDQFNVIHYFKTAYYDIFEWTIKAMTSCRILIPVITTICQRPSTKGLLLSPYEINKSDALVFIDRSAYNDSLISFIPEYKKSCIYFGTPETAIVKTQQLIDEKAKRSKESSIIIFGRGSTLSKCPPDMIEVYNKITYPHKKFIIAGIKQNSWVEEKAEKYNDIEVIGTKPFEEWLKICNEFDIFLYYIPKDSHSSIDGTLGQAMLLEKPVVYYGPEAPKERFINGENALIAEEVEQIPELCDRLANDFDLRYRLGKNARLTSIRDFHINTTIKLYNELYDNVRKRIKLQVKIPYKYYIKFYSYCWKRIFKSQLGGSWIEKLYFRLKPIK